MPPPRAHQRANSHAPQPPRIYRRCVKKLSRVRLHADPTSMTLFFITPGGGAGNSRSTFIAPEHVPPFEGDEAWFEMELVEGKPWSFWRAIRQVEPPAHARA